MAITVKVSEWGNSLAIRLPKAVVDQLGLKAGGEVQIELRGDFAQLTLSPQEAHKLRHDRMTLDMKRLKALGVEEPEFSDWGPSVGDEKLPDEDWSQEFEAWKKKTKNAG